MGCSYALAVRVVKSLELHNIGMTNNAHDLQLSVLRSPVLAYQPLRLWQQLSTDLESLVLKNALDGSVLPGWGELRLEDNAEGTVADNLALGILQIPGLTSDTVLHLFANDLCGALLIHGIRRRRHLKSYPPS